jgi:hypothetical protein
MRKWLVISGAMIVSVLVLAGGVIWYIRGHQEDDLVRAVEKLVGYEVPVENESAPKGPVVLNSTTDENSKNSASNDLAVGSSEAGQLPQMLPPNGQSQSKSKPSPSSDSAQNVPVLLPSTIGTRIRRPRFIRILALVMGPRRPVVRRCW